MSSISLQVELPQYAHSFIVNVPQSGTVHEVKQEIARACPGNPRIESQRLIWRGRVLADTEKIEQIWKVSRNKLIRIIFYLLINIKSTSLLMNVLYT